MTRIALIKNGVVDNVIESDLEFASTLPDYDTVIASEVAGPGWLYTDGTLVSNDVEVIGTASPSTPLSFLRRFTLAERIDIQQSEDPIVKDAMLMFNVAQDVQLDDPDTVAFVHYIANMGIISQARADEILEVVN